MSLLLLFQNNMTTSSGGGTTFVYPTPILLLKKGKLAIWITGNEYMEL